MKDIRVCQVCGGKGKVVRGHIDADGTYIRYRVCMNCGARCSTREDIDMPWKDINRAKPLNDYYAELRDKSYKIDK